MARIPKVKELVNTSIASGYGGWIYCASCGENIGYLCYVTYDNFCFSYECKCGGKGDIHIAFDIEMSAIKSNEELVTIKNRLCCGKDDSPLFTILYPKLKSYQYEIDCIKCCSKYIGGNI